jgi:hypothetical protein
MDDRFDPKHLPAVQRVLRADRAGPIAMAVTGLGAAFVVITVLYGMTREPLQQIASGPATSQQDGGGATPAQAGGTAPSTTGQAPAQAITPQQNQGQQSQTRSGAPASGRSATGTVGGPSARPAPQAIERQGESSPEGNAR